MSSLESIRNFVQLTPDFGTAGQPRREQFTLIADSGFVAVVNLALPEHPDSIDDEGRLVSELGLDYCHLPVPYDNPEFGHLRRFCTLLDAYRGDRVFVHCIMNYRVSAFMFHYLTGRRGLAPEQARSPIFDRWQLQPQWQAIMQLDPQRLALTRD